MCPGWGLWGGAGGGGGVTDLRTLGLSPTGLRTLGLSLTASESLVSGPEGSGSPFSEHGRALLEPQVPQPIRQSHRDSLTGTVSQGQQTPSQTPQIRKQSEANSLQTLQNTPEQTPQKTLRGKLHTNST